MQIPPSRGKFACKKLARRRNRGIYEIHAGARYARRTLRYDRGQLFRLIARGVIGCY